MQEFIWLNKQGVQSVRGFVLQFTGRFTVEYREGTKRMTLQIESGITGGKPSIIVDPNAFAHWDDDPAGIVLSAQQQRQILENVKEAVEFQGLALAVESPEESPSSKSFRR